MATIEVQDPILPTREAAKYIGRKEQTLTNWRCTDAVRIPYVRIGRCVGYRLSALEAFIRQNTVNAVESE